jgi:hypothetical protein
LSSGTITTPLNCKLNAARKKNAVRHKYRPYTAQSVFLRSVSPYDTIYVLPFFPEPVNFFRLLSQNRYKFLVSADKPTAHPASDLSFSATIRNQRL